MLDAIDKNTKIIFIVTHNLQGHIWDRDRVTRFLGQWITDNCVMDEAYFEFVEKRGLPCLYVPYPRYPNLVVFRTFSKMYGLAGLRIGYWQETSML
jgi:histidinol-phosphate aminotransferase